MDNCKERIAIRLIHPTIVLIPLGRRCLPRVAAAVRRSNQQPIGHSCSCAAVAAIAGYVAQVLFIAIIRDAACLELAVSTRKRVAAAPGSAAVQADWSRTHTSWHIS